jgi:4'-phosphopantetheinyl transferase
VRQTTGVLVDASDEVIGRFPGARGLLTDAERERADSFRSTLDSNDYVAAHVLVRLCAARVLDTTPQRLTVIQQCDTCGGPHGRPSVKEEPHCAVSLSHSHGWVAACAGPGTVGVDIEVLAGRRREFAVISNVLAPAERSALRASADPRRTFLGLWVQKEALIKAGCATLRSLAAVDLSRQPERWGGLYLTTWHTANGLLGACASSTPDVWLGAARPGAELRRLR